MKQEMTWQVADLWNQSVISINKEIKPRDYLYASELGYPMVDTWLKLNGIAYTNPPNMRSLRKFEAGNIWEFIVRIVLERAGILKETQERIEYQYDGLLKVVGKLDFLGGGVPDFEKAQRAVAGLHLPESLEKSSLYIVEKLSHQFGDKPLKDIVIEMKSCSTFVMDMIEKTEKPLPHHKNQIFHYLKGLNMTEGHILYVCKDDCRMAEFPIFNPSRVELEYVAQIRKISEYYYANERPPLKTKSCSCPKKAYSKRTYSSNIRLT